MSKEPSEFEKYDSFLRKLSHHYAELSIAMSTDNFPKAVTERREIDSLYAGEISYLEKREKDLEMRLASLEGRVFSERRKGPVQAELDYILGRLGEVRSLVQSPRNNQDNS